MRMLTVKLPKHLNDALDRIAQSSGKSRSAVVREALETYALERVESALTRAGELVGSLAGLPRDLSTNPKYMKDFGK